MSETAVMRRFHGVAGRVLMSLLLLNFATGWADSFFYGDGHFAKAENGHYYLNRHGEYVEVGRAHFQLSRFQSPTILPSFLALVLMGLWANRSRTNDKS
jgi:hypothetical protein